jgi:hypothetical protein
MSVVAQLGRAIRPLRGGLHIMTHMMIRPADQPRESHGAG